MEAHLAYRAPMPHSDAFVRWPDAFGTRFAIFADTEEEFEWSGAFTRGPGGVTHMRMLPEAHGRFVAAGVPVTYLIDYPIATSSLAVDALREALGDRRSAIGTQLHPWVSPPFDEELSVYNSFAGNLPSEIEETKLAHLTSTIEITFGRHPRIYRAGRYGVGSRTLNILERLGYVADTSMRSRYDYSPEGGPDFTDIPNHAFHVGRMVELPFTTVHTGLLRSAGTPLYHALGKLPRGRGIASRLGLLSRVSLTPEDMPIGDALEAIRVAAGEGLQLLNFSFHSPSIEPGHTPYVRDAADLADFWRWWDRAFALLAELGVTPASLDEILEAACGSPSASANATPAGGL